MICQDTLTRDRVCEVVDEYGAAWENQDPARTGCKVMHAIASESKSIAVLFGT